MFKLTLRLFISLFVVRSVSCLTCYETHTWKCRGKYIDAYFFFCLRYWAYTECESPKLCLKGHIKAPQIGTGWDYEAPVRGCGLIEDCEKLLHDLLDSYVPMATPNLTLVECRSCNDSDLCNLFGGPIFGLKHKKSLKGSKNSTPAPSAPLKKKSGESRSHTGITTIHQMSIFLHILLLLYSYLYF